MAVTLGQARNSAVDSETAAVAAIPFTRASRRKSQVAAQTSTVTLGASTNQPLPPILVPSAGYLRGIELICTISSTGNSATVALAAIADAPFSVLNQISFVNSAGENLYAPISGFSLYLNNKFGSFLGHGRANNPTQWQDYSAPSTGAGATAGSAAFTLWLPLEIDPSQGFCALPNLAANRAYQIQATLNSVSTLFAGGTAPNGTVTFTMTAIEHYWAQPYPTSPVGVPQEISPVGVGSMSLMQLETVTIGAAADLTIQSHNVGNVIRYIMLVLRDGSGIRTSANLPAVIQLILNNDTLRYWTLNALYSEMQRDYGLTGAISSVASATALDRGVLVFSDWMSLSASNNGPNQTRDQYLATLNATLLQIKGTSFGAAGTLEIYTNSIKPASAAALYQAAV